MEYKPTYIPPIDITKRFNEFLIYETIFCNGMEIPTQFEVDKYFRGELPIEKLDKKIYSKILEFEKYEFENGEYRYVPKKECLQKKETISEKLNREPALTAIKSYLKAIIGIKKHS